MIQLQNYTLKEDISLSPEMLGIYIEQLWQEIFVNAKEDHMLLLCRVKFNDQSLGYRTLGHLIKVNYEDKELFTNYLSERLTILDDSYIHNPICQISFSYIIKSGKCLDEKRALETVDNKELTVHNFNNMNLPISMNPSDYGTIIISNIITEEGITFERFIVVNRDKTYQIDVIENGQVNRVRILGAINLSWVDTLLSEEQDLFKREIKKSTIYFMDGEVVLRKKEIPCKPFSPLFKESSKSGESLNNNYITMDIESIRVDKKVKPYLINSYDGRQYLTSYNHNEIELFREFFTKLINQVQAESYPNKIFVYAHNFSTFDGVLILKHLFQFGRVEPLIYNGKLISVTLIVNKTTIIFKDSMLMLPQSLSELCKSFNLEQNKGLFPFNLMDIYYKGSFPRFEYWTDIGFFEHEDMAKAYKGKIWSFKDEAIKYCKLDCLVLHQILTKFNDLIFNKWQININSALTLSSLAMRIYKTHCLPKNTVYQLLGQIESDIRQSYSGGAVDVYIPHNRIAGFFNNIKAKFIKLYCYDVNALYPTIMANTPMPVGQPIAFDGNIRAVEPEAFGYFYCKITSPEFLEHPLLQRRIKTSEGIRTIAGLGSWEGWIFSGEMYNAIKFGYTFEILKGYQFKTANIFKEYVDTMYNLRLQYDKSHPMNFIAKLLMNSLYGKFAMKKDSTIIEIFNSSIKKENQMFEELLDTLGESIENIFKIGNHFITIRKSLSNYNYEEEEDIYHGLEVNIAIASTISGGARMWMSILKNCTHPNSVLKNHPKFNLYYSDTDSGIIDAPLPSYLVGPNLGQFKLEHVVDKAVFLAPKVYGLITTDGEEILKVKGLNKDSLDNINFNELELLLIKDSSKEFTQDKWFKKIIEGEITVNEVAYNLKVTSNKRAPIYIDNVYTNTKPYNYEDISSN